MSEEPELETHHEEFCVKEPAPEDEQAVYFRVVDRERVEAWPAADDSPVDLSLYDLWRTTLEEDVRRIDRSDTPWNGGEPDK